MSYGQTIKWTEFWGDKYTASRTGHETLEIAQKLVLEDAKKLGWTPRRWWQCWRWHDTKVKWS